MLDDETLRDGLQSPSVRAPSIEQKIRILHLIDALGIDTADIGLPGAGPHVVARRRSAGRARSSARRLRVQRQLRRAHARQRHHADRRDRAADRRADRVLHVHRLVADPAVHRRLDARLAAASAPRRRSRSPCKQGLDVMYVTEDTTRADPDTLRAIYQCAIRAGAKRICIADTVGHATPAGAAAVVRFVAEVINGQRRRGRHRLARPPRSRPRGR